MVVIGRSCSTCEVDSISSRRRRCQCHAAVILNADNEMQLEGIIDDRRTRVH